MIGNRKCLMIIVHISITIYNMRNNVLRLIGLRGLLLLLLMVVVDRVHGERCW